MSKKIRVPKPKAGGKKVEAGKLFTCFADEVVAEVDVPGVVWLSFAGVNLGRHKGKIKCKG